jgi:hypothetical protein
MTTTDGPLPFVAASEQRRDLAYTEQSRRAAPKATPCALLTALHRQGPSHRIWKGCAEQFLLRAANRSAHSHWHGGCSIADPITRRRSEPDTRRATLEFDPIGGRLIERAWAPATLDARSAYVAVGFRLYSFIHHSITEKNGEERQ